MPGSSWFLIDGIITLLLGLMIYMQWPSSSAWAIRHADRRKPDRQRPYAGNAFVGSTQGNRYDLALLIGLWFLSQLFHAGEVAHVQTGGVAYLAHTAALSSVLPLRVGSRTGVKLRDLCPYFKGFVPE